MQGPFCKGRKVLMNFFVMGKYGRFPVARRQIVRKRKIKLCRREESSKQAERRRGRGEAERAHGRRELGPKSVQLCAGGRSLL